jgi:hypothetical protein
MPQHSTAESKRDYRKWHAFDGDDATWLIAEWTTGRLAA